ncbi:O-methyltransferase [Candidatus Mesenet endosymbiont of Agriotes lineatus]|uniref:O-methyltransferase n=1 Tax=Candidatus Mesenet endosymbiont of Agriotes lineatus TaxID=3077948 RepID=UPI0030CBA8A9
MRDKNLDDKSLYIRQTFTKEYAELGEAFINKEKYLIQISAEEGRLLGLFIKMNNIKTIVEIGTLYGYSSILMAKALPSDGHIYTIEKSNEYADIAAQNFADFKVDDKITLMRGNGLDQLKKLEANSPLDMIFIDADKASYTDYLDWAELHIRQRGLIIADNTLLFDTIYLESPPKWLSEKSWYNMKDFNTRLANVKKYYSMLIPTKEDMTIALKLI